MAEFQDKTERVFRGTPVSRGVAYGKARVIDATFDAPHSRLIQHHEVEEELELFHAALSRTRVELEGLIDRLDEKEDRHAREILEMHIMVLEDGVVREQVERIVRDEKECAECAYFRVVKNCMASFQRIPDAYLRERALDIKDVAKRVLRQLRGDHDALDEDGPPAIYIAHDLTPSETAQLDRTRVLGFAVELGSKTSHTAIIARSLGLPAVVRLHDVLDELRQGDDVLMDGNEGLLIINPTEQTRARYREKEAISEAKEAKLLLGSGAPAVTKDGVRITVAANAEFVEEMPHIKDCGAEGVGLFRTEFLYLENPRTSEKQLTNLYSEVVKAAAPDLVVFRTLDLGGDKLEPATMDDSEENPFLGWRGIRVSLAMREMFKQQLRAMLKASIHGPIAIMYPMVSSVGEVIAANKLLTECQDELRGEGFEVPETVLKGAMIEIPSAATIADLLARHVDFFSIGTNDLVQYTLAVDRVNERVSYLYQPTHPAVLRLIKSVVEAAHAAKIWVGMCGEMAGDISMTPLLIGLGLDELSAICPQVAKVKHAIRHLNAAACRELLNKALMEEDPIVIQRMSLEFAGQHYAELMAE